MSGVKWGEWGKRSERRKWSERGFRRQWRTWRQRGEWRGGSPPATLPAIAGHRCADQASRWHRRPWQERRRPGHGYRKSR